MKQDTSKKRVKKKKEKKKKEREKEKRKDREKKGKKKEIKLEVGSTNQRMEAVQIVDGEDGGDKNATVWSLQPWTFGTDAKRQTGAVETAKKKKVELSPNKETNGKTEEVEIIDIEDDDDGDEASSQPQVSGQDAKQQKTRTEDGDEEEHAAAKTMENMEAVEIVDSDDGDGDEDSSTPQPHVSGRDSQQTSAEARKVLENSTPGPSAANTDGSLPPAGAVQKPQHLCEVCQTYHQSRGILMRHVWRSHVNNQSLVCGVCRQRCDSNAALKEHLQTHKKTYTCKICGKMFFTRSGCRRHMIRHKGGDPEQK
ncbi:PREDICTED: zinc finger and BTB domain-containing protein 14-like [Poecilia mexicana]|nr:PREDICTED: zinc finger and BTB domain-containing protein 14-like [Poecilia mexicana]